MTRARDVANIDGLLTATGDIYYASAAATPTRLGIGSSGQFLTVSGGIPAWAAPAGSLTSLATGTLSGSEVSLTGISSSYTNLYLTIFNPYASAETRIGIRVNTSAGNYNAVGGKSTSASYLSQGLLNYFDPYLTTSTLLTSSTDYKQLAILIPNYSTTNLWKHIWVTGRDQEAGYFAVANTPETAAISSVQIRTITGGTTFSGGTYTLYGVK